MKRYLFTLEIVVLVLLLPMIAFAQNPANIYLNGNKLTDKWAPVFADSNTYIPLAVVTEQLQIEGSIAVADGQSSFVLKDSGSRNQLREFNGTYYIPARFLSEQFGLKITRDMLTGSVYLFDRVAAQNSAGEPAAQVPANPLINGLMKKENVHIDLLNPTNSRKMASIDTIVSSGDNIIIRADAELSPTVFYIANPSRIVMDFPFSRFAEKLNGTTVRQNGEIASYHPYIDKIRYAMFSAAPSTLRVVIDMNQEAKYAVLPGEEGQFILSIPSDSYKISIDAGHGGHDPGSMGASKLEEKWINLSLAQKVYSLLLKETGIAPSLIRTDDTYISTQDRTDAANRREVDLFISIHANSYETNGIRGTETYYYNRNSIPLAEILHKHVLEATGFPDRNVRKMNYKVIKETTMPSALLEIGYLSNPNEEAILLSEDMQNKVASSIVKGIMEFRQLAK